MHHSGLNSERIQSTAGAVISGDMTDFLAQLKMVYRLTAGNIHDWKISIYDVWFPAAALAMYHAARPERKKIVAGIIASGPLTSFLTGITDHLNFHSYS